MYVIRPHINFDLDITVNIVPEYSVEYQTYMYEDHDSVLESCDSELIEAESFNVGSEGGVFGEGNISIEIPSGALLLVSDQPMVIEGVKTEKSDEVVTNKFVDEHLKIGIDSLKQLINKGETVKHLYFDYYNDDNE